MTSSDKNDWSESTTGMGEGRWGCNPLSPARSAQTG
eukprot:CAMPEP_0181138626 /NCGR_PEP_ID=MMETSP1071-20121207/34347_1 /TAXON_ID=35127 /ORGANISM="Thalassiosira sp., Strain NH16" /LENGTH=35 /DNA_ID= /DNA_START= /DNA_END= /DNA_ORIENTATION=